MKNILLKLIICFICFILFSCGNTNSKNKLNPLVYDKCGYLLDNICVRPKSIVYGKDAYYNHIRMLIKYKNRNKSYIKSNKKFTNFINDFNKTYSNHYTTVYILAHAIYVEENHIYFVFDYDSKIKNPVFIQYDNYSIFIPNFVSILKHYGYDVDRYYKLDNRIAYHMKKSNITKRYTRS